jgi:DNA-binding MarR family transcriptional regulator
LWRSTEYVRVKILAEIDRAARVEHRPPTMKELGAATGMPFTSAFHHLDMLVKAGLLARRPGMRGITVTPAGRLYLRQALAAERAQQAAEQAS